MKSEIKIIGETLDDHETYRGECPYCGRGSTFTVTRKDGGLVWNCYSAHCGRSGFYSGTGRRPSVLPRPKARRSTITPFLGTLAPLSDEWIDFLAAKVGFDERHLSLASPMIATEEHRVAYPIYSPMGVRRGWSLRSYSLGVQPKALTRMDIEEPHLAWFRPNSVDDPVIVVEDIPSAVRVVIGHTGCASVAMCGGGIGPAYAHEISQFGRDVVWAFDEDATLVALEHHRRYSLYFDSSRVLPLEKDFKDMTEEEICSTLESV